MSQPIGQIGPLPPTPPTRSLGADKPQGNFLSAVNTALEHVSETQGASDAQNRALIKGAPGASLEKAVVASGHARIEWNATVAVRNQVVNAYRTIMNMPV